jgi:hypothetical protein
MRSLRGKILHLCPGPACPGGGRRRAPEPGILRGKGRRKREAGQRQLPEMMRYIASQMFNLLFLGSFWPGQRAYLRPDRFLSLNPHGELGHY